MKKYLQIISVLVLAAFMFASCKSSEQKQIDRIRAIEAALAQDTEGVPSKEKVIELIEAYEAFSEAFPAHELTPEFLFNAGKYCMSYNFSLRAVDFFDRIIDNYPDFDKHPDSYFLKGFVYDSQLNNIPQARLTYETFIEAYPEHELAIEAGHLINLLGKSLDEIIAEFEAKNSLTADADTISE